MYSTFLNHLFKGHCVSVLNVFVLKSSILRHTTALQGLKWSIHTDISLALTSLTPSSALLQTPRRADCPYIHTGVSADKY